MRVAHVIRTVSRCHYRHGLVRPPFLLFAPLPSFPPYPLSPPSPLSSYPYPPHVFLLLSPCLPTCPHAGFPRDHSVCGWMSRDACREDEDDGRWACERCTLLNPTKQRQCEACGCSRSPSLLTGLLPPPASPSQQMESMVSLAALAASMPFDDVHSLLSPHPTQAPWSCKACTFENLDGTRSACCMCNAPRVAPLSATTLALSPEEAPVTALSIDLDGAGNTIAHLGFLVGDRWWYFSPEGTWRARCSPLSFSP
jgi:hypothetical protein